MSSSLKRGALSGTPFLFLENSRGIGIVVLGLFESHLKRKGLNYIHLFSNN